MAARGLPVAHAGQAPPLRFIGKAADGHPQQAGLLRPSGRSLFKPQLHQKRSALAAGTPAGQMKGEIQAFRLSEGPGQGVIAPGGEVGAGIGEVVAKQRRDGRDALGQFHRSDLV